MKIICSCVIMVIILLYIIDILKTKGESSERYLCVISVFNHGFNNLI
ncbi:hypothetical protein LCGC14_1264560 [marine sediment metagenome]|uniref:Uncharacterized protein n=1 Tax=marine sediment metagenome TaxID=412755 RepID=A0A0F9KZW5_9ZZZZ